MSRPSDHGGLSGFFRATRIAPANRRKCSSTLNFSTAGSHILRELACQVLAEARDYFIILISLEL